MQCNNNYQIFTLFSSCDFAVQKSNIAHIRDGFANRNQMLNKKQRRNNHSFFYGQRIQNKISWTIHHDHQKSETSSSCLSFMLWSNSTICILHVLCFILD